LIVGFEFAWGEQERGKVMVSSEEILKQPGLVRSEFVFGDMAFTECHAPTIVESSDGLIAGWMSGRHKKHYDVGVWYSRRVDGKWTEPAEIVRAAASDGERSRLWNPTMYQVQNGPLLLFFRNGPSPHSWWGMMMQSGDSGQSWSKAERLGESFFGPTKNKPVMLEDGTLVCGSSTEKGGWKIHMEFTKDLGRTWSKTESIADPCRYNSIQPTILTHSDGRLQILCRTGKKKKIVTSFSTDKGKTWTALRQIHLPNASAGIDAVTLQDGRFLLVYNHTNRWKSGPDQRRERINVAVSYDGINWKAALLLEHTLIGEFAYPAVIQSADGKVHILYSWNRRKLKYVELDPNKLLLRDMVMGQWPVQAFGLRE
jgi:predicted neuraminidase